MTISNLKNYVMIKKTFSTVFFIVYSLMAVAQTVNHPIYFITKQTINKVGGEARTNPKIAGYIHSIVNEAKKVKIDDLKPFEYGWIQEQQQIKALTKRDRDLSLINNNHIPDAYAKAAMLLGQAYVHTGNVEFAEKGKKILLMLSEYQFKSDDVNRGLDWGIVNLDAIKAYDLLYSVFSGKERAKMQDFFERLVEGVMNCNDYWCEHEPGGPVNNHFGWHSNCFFTNGMFFNKPELVNRAIFGSHGFDYALRYGFQDDGIWLEGSLPYMFMQMSAMFEAALMAKNAGYKIDLFTYKTADGRTIKQAFDAVFGLLFPDGSVPPIGDGYGRISYPGEGNLYAILYEIYKDPKYAWLVNRANKGDEKRSQSEKNEQKYRERVLQYGILDIPQAPPPSQTSRLFYEHGFAALRTVEGTEYWNGDGTTLFAAFARNECHHHEDKFSIMLYGDGHLWLRDCEARPTNLSGWGSKANLVLNGKSLCHNTAMIDYRSQKRTIDQRLEVQEYATLPDAKYVTMGDLHGQLYPGVYQLRKCIVTKDYVLDVFQVKANADHKITWVTHIDGNSLAGENRDNQFEFPMDANWLADDKDWKSFELPEGEEWTFIKNARIKNGVQSIRYEELFEYGSKRFKMDMICDKPFDVIACDFPKIDTFRSFYPMRMFTTQGKSAMFIAVYRHGDNIDKPIRIESAEGKLKNYEVSVKIGDKTSVHRIPVLTN